MWIADAKSVLASSNCIYDCDETFDFKPKLEFLGFADYLKSESMIDFSVSEFGFSAILNRNIMTLNYIDMKAVIDRTSEAE